MELDSADFSGRVTFITGPEKGCGKTSLLLRVLALLRETGERAAFLGVGLEGDRAQTPAGRGRNTGDRGKGAGGPAPNAARIACRAGEVFVSAESYLRAADCECEILDALPGSSALGRLAVARARRDGHVVLVGPERNEILALAIEQILAEGWARTVLVDGALNRMTQASSFGGARFIFAARLGPGELERQARAIRRLNRLATLPVAGPSLPGPVHRIAGPLTADTLASVPAAARSIVVDDFTKVFLDAGGLCALLRDRILAVRDRPEFGGFVVVLRDIPRERFERVLDDPEAASRIAYNPYEAAHA